ncbi:MAG: hypothetical protein IJ092_09385 [Atopobiaceae bacterium]|nr:hypothetical protein [Atopobiaceae bacterium]
MKQLSSYMVLAVNGGDRISYTFDEIDDETGEPISTNNKASFYVVDESLRAHVDAIRSWIKSNKLAE